MRSDPWPRWVSSAVLLACGMNIAAATAVLWFWLTFNYSATLDLEYESHVFWYCLSGTFLDICWK
jgi:hypothetical protein